VTHLLARAPRTGASLDGDTTMVHETARCSEREGPLRPIRVFEHGQRTHFMLKRTSIESERGWFIVTQQVEGRLSAELCESCGRVSFRALPVG
jgi:hypothetical protein